MADEIEKKSHVNRNQMALRITLVYGVFGVLWILFSDKMLSVFVQEKALFIHLEIFKGWFYVLITALMVYWFIQRNVSALESSKESLRKANSILRTLSECNRTLIHAKDELELMKDICRIVVDHGGYRLAWVGATGDDREKKVKPVAHYGYEEGYLDTLNVTWDDTESGHGPIGRAIRSGVTSVFQNILTNPDFDPWREEALKRKYASVIALPLKDKDEPFGVLSIYAAESDAFDGDELRLLEELANDLAFGILNLRMRTERKLLREELHQAQKMEAIGTLAGGIAHDFNNILGAIITCSEVALDDLTDDHPVHEDLRQIFNAGQRGKKLVQQILSFSRTGKQEEQAVQLRILVKECLSMLRTTLPSNIDIRKHISVDTGCILANPTQIHQVIMNLCTNAAQAIGEQVGVLEVRLESVTLNTETAAAAVNLPDGPYFELTVKDSGHGMASDVLEKIFDPFFTTRGKSGGTGIGLSVVYGIVKRSGGRIIVDSTPGNGTTFRVFLPKIGPLDAIDDESTDRAFKGGSERILLVDDDLELRYAVEKMLKSLGYSVQTAATGTDALEVFHRDPGRFDLIMTDQTMPKMMGTELATRILAIRPEMPIILCSGFKTNSQSRLTAAQAEAFGICFFMQKPFARAEIAGVIRDALEYDANKPE